MGNQSLRRLVFPILLVLSTATLGKRFLGQSSPSYERVIIDSLDADGWNGIVFLPLAFHLSLTKIPSGTAAGAVAGGTMNLTRVCVMYSRL